LAADGGGFDTGRGVSQPVRWLGGGRSSWSAFDR
jgi:hypothetical protein